MILANANADVNPDASAYVVADVDAAGGVGVDHAALHSTSSNRPQPSLRLAPTPISRPM